jgi:hypothetical protein
MSFFLQKMLSLAGGEITQLCPFCILKLPQTQKADAFLQWALNMQFL